MIIWLRSTLFFIGYLFIILVITPLLLIPSLPLPYHHFRRVVRFWCALILGWLRITTGIRYNIVGAEYLNALTQQPHVIIANHQSAFETLLFSKILPPHAFILKKELLNIPFVGWGLRKAKQIPIDRNDGRRALQNIITASKEAFDEGRSVVIFPEGTRAKPDQILRYQSGGFAIAQKLAQPILPISHNAGLAWPRNSYLKRPGTITVTIGPPISTEGKKTNELRQETERWIRHHMIPELKE